ncbi:MAG TPA: MgtC/SapB family protein [Patescibacteria group bacterium]|nr:MgtC/SapB family protein [Patescibacteria group bacterium]
MFKLGLDTNLSITIKILVSAILGIIIGFDREKSGKPAGIRTQMLVCVGSTLLSAMSVDMVEVVNLANIAPGLYSFDPARLMAQIISGIGFLGAGVIIKNGSKVQGVTTAATIWITAAVGMAVGSGFFLAAGICVILVLLLNPLAHLQYKYGLKGDFYIATVKLKYQNKLEAILEKNLVDIRQRSVQNNSLTVLIHSSKQTGAKIIEDLKKKKIPFEFKVSLD